jgi:hypothetical protein
MSGAAGANTDHYLVKELDRPRPSYSTRAASMLERWFVAYVTKGAVAPQRVCPHGGEAIGDIGRHGAVDGVSDLSVTFEATKSHCQHVLANTVDPAF